MIYQFDVGRQALRSRICLQDGVNVLPGLQRIVQRRPDRAFTLEQVDGSQQKQPEKHAQNAPGGGRRYLQRNRNGETVPRGSEQTDGGCVFAGVDRNRARQHELGALRRANGIARHRSHRQHAGGQRAIDAAQRIDRTMLEDSGRGRDVGHGNTSRPQRHHRRAGRERPAPGDLPQADPVRSRERCLSRFALFRP